MSQSQNDDHFLTGATGDEQMSKRWPVNDEQMGDWVVFKHLPALNGWGMGFDSSRWM